MIHLRALLLVCLLMPLANVHAEPYLAVQSGLKCMSCHVNPTGGGMRTDYGAIYGQTLLSARQPIKIWNGDISEQFSIGGDARANYDNVNIPNQDNRSEFNVEEALIYAEFELIKDRITFYLDQQVAPGSASNREFYGLFWFQDKKIYLKAGRMFLPFGFRIEDDTAFTRSVPGINYNTPDTGVEAGLELEKVSLNFAITNGTAGGGETDQGKQVSLRGSYIQNQWRIGGSYNFNDVDGGDRTMGGVFAGLRTGKVSWLGEVAYIRDEGFGTGPREQLVSLAEANINFKKGHNLKLTYEFFEPDNEVDEDDRTRVSAVYEYFPIQFTQLSVGFRHSDGIPQSDFQNTEEAFVQLHIYF
ncbi:MAG: hypothetical protein AAF438_09475 [Pseudomonadota bacterium]